MAFDCVALRAQVAQLAFVFPRFFDQLKPLVLEFGTTSFELLDVGRTDRRTVLCRTGSGV